MPRVSEISILHQLATSRKRSAEEIMGWGEGGQGVPAHGALSGFWWRLQYCASGCH